MLLDAIAVLLFQRMNLEDTHEYAAVVIQTASGEYRATLPSRQQEGNFRVHVSLQAGEHIAAIVHTHPDSRVAWDRSGEFSQDDIDVANQLHVPSYVYFQKLKQIRVYTPGQGEKELK